MIETLSSIEPLLFEDQVPRRLADLACQIQQEVAFLERGLPSDTLREMAALLRHNCGSASNLIDEGGLASDPCEEPLKREERADAKAHSAAEAQAEASVLGAIDAAYAAGTLASPTSVAFLTWAHRSFHQTLASLEGRVPDQRSLLATPGRLREGSEEGGFGDQAPARVEILMAHFERRFAASECWPSARIIAVAAAHHRLNLIRPFPYGNGRISRLMSHAMVMRAGIGGGGLWSISHGLAGAHRDYHRLMLQAGLRRTGDHDGTGQLSAAALKAFSEWMLSVMLEEIRSARASFALEDLEPRYRRLLRGLDYDDKAQDLAGAILRFGQIDRGDACVVLKTSERTARNALSGLVQGGFLKSATPKGPVRIAFPADHRNALFPRIFAAPTRRTADAARVFDRCDRHRRIGSACRVPRQ